MQPTQNTAGPAGQPTRSVAGRPETNADRRFFDLREAGYLGPIDQDGHPAVSLWPNQPVPANIATTLRQTARYLSRYGWIQGCYYDQTAMVFTPAACMVGALGMVCYGGPCDAPAQMFDAPGFAEFEQALAYLDDFLAVGYGLNSFQFNDTKGRTEPQVIAELCRAAQLWEHLDADPAHQGDAHTPGTGELHCSTCTGVCFCAGGFQCLRCTLINEYYEDVVGQGGAA
jgi:hypothetical protein